MKTLESVVIENNLMAIGDWYLEFDRTKQDPFILEHKTDGRKWYFEFLEDAVENAK